MQYPWGLVLRIWLTGTAYPHGYWGYDSRVLHILTGTEDMTHGYWWYDSRVMHILTGTAYSLYRVLTNKFDKQCISQFQAPTSPPGDPRGFALHCCPGAGIYTWWPSPRAGFLHIHKITLSTVKKYTFTQLAFGSYLHALHRQFWLSILAWLNTKILK